MIDWGSNLSSAMRFKKGGDFRLRKIRTVLIENVKEKSKNRNKEIQLKIMNCFLICIFVTSCPNKT